MHQNKLGLFVRTPVSGTVKTRLVPPLTADQARDLYLAFLQDLTARITGSRLRPTVFLAGDDPGALKGVFPASWPVVPQSGGALGERLNAAFSHLLARPGNRAAIIGSDSPDLPLGHVHRAFKLLKHRDVVLGPATDGGYYLIGLRAMAPSLFQHIDWGTPTVLAATTRAVETARLTLGLTPPWYDVDDPASLALLRALCAARRTARGERLPHIERCLAVIDPGE
jgi:rSAM/selenodomain-associated transferase 1